MLSAAPSWIRWAACAVVLMLGTGLAGWAIGRHHESSSEFKVEPGIVYATPYEGTAYLGADQQLNRQPNGIAYSFPPDIAWIDANGVIHFGGRPACVPYYHAVRVKNMEAVSYPIAGASSFTVLWVQC
jgi:hypothetical protein